MNPDAGEFLGRNGSARLWPLAAVLVVATLSVTAAVAMAFELRGDVARLEQQARSAAKAQKTLRDEVAALREKLEPVAPEVAAPAPVAVNIAAAAVAIPAEARAAPRAINVGHRMPPRAAGPGSGSDRGPLPQCVFEPGNPQALTDCIERQQGALEAMQARFR